MAKRDINISIIEIESVSPNLFHGAVPDGCYRRCLRTEASSAPAALGASGTEPRRTLIGAVRATPLEEVSQPVRELLGSKPQTEGGCGLDTRRAWLGYRTAAEQENIEKY